jgi:DsbC/DsbD-like thiol-disulfide interchange protein
MMKKAVALIASSAAGCALLFAAGRAAAADASRWDGDGPSRARLIAGSQAPDATVLRAGVEIRLAPRWHTYWRYPGDAGVPPQFDFKSSTNVKDARVLWPAPQRLQEAGETSIGYTDRVLFPLQVVPQEPNKPTLLRLKLGYAICEKLCVPAEATLELALAPGTTASQEAALAAAEAQVPKKAHVGDGGELAVRTVARDSGAAKPRVLVDVASPPNAPVALFAEGPTPQWALPVPTMLSDGSAAVKRFAFELDGAPSGAAYSGAMLTLTAVSGQKAIEVSFRLD